MPEPIKVLCAPNALKGTLSAVETARALAAGVRRALPQAEIVELPIADGGDGTREVLTRTLGGQERWVTVTDPLGRQRTAAFSVITSDAGQRTAVIDVASASGIALLRQDELDPVRASSFGTGALLRSALESGIERLILGVGGSATVDGGTGVLAALGARFLDARGAEVTPGGGGLAHIEAVELGGILPAARQSRLCVACDVDNPLVGPAGAARVFGPQKGAGTDLVVRLEAGLERLAAALSRATGKDPRTVARGGAAGGIAAALWAALDAELVSGVDLVLDTIGFEEALHDAALVLTAEGRLDAGSLGNKGPVGVARRAAHYGVPTLAFVGSRTADVPDELLPFADVIVFGAERFAPAEAIRTSVGDLTRTAEAAIRALHPLAPRRPR
ncbi:MAG TPA: glycerate kinase [Polyangiaceae bacterium]